MISKIALGHEMAKKCGNYIYRIKELNGADYGERYYELYYQKEGAKKKLFYQSEHGIAVNAACIQDIKKKYLMLFLEFCGGNGCSEEMYGLFDPEQEKILIHPTEGDYGNSKLVEKLIGYYPPSYREKIFFCCNRLRN